MAPRVAACFATFVVSLIIAATSVHLSTARREIDRRYDARTLCYNDFTHFVYDHDQFTSLLSTIRGPLERSHLGCVYRPASTSLLAEASYRRCKYASSRLPYYNNSDATYNLLLSGDIHSHPGPATDIERHLTADEEHGGADHSPRQLGAGRITYSSVVLMGLRRQDTLPQLTDCVIQKLRLFGLFNVNRPRGRRAGTRVQRRKFASWNSAGNDLIYRNMCV
jgi:hypothetical protein